MSLQFVLGDATCPPAEHPAVIVHICNDMGGWGKGFVLALSKRWPAPEAEYREWCKQQGNNDFGLGAVQFVQVGQQLWVANLVGQHRLHPQDGVPPIRYQAVQVGLAEVAKFAATHGAGVHMPRIGCGLAGGRWEDIELLIQKELIARGVPVTVYDFGAPS